MKNKERNVRFTNEKKLLFYEKLNSIEKKGFKTFQIPPDIYKPSLIKIFNDVKTARTSRLT